MIIFSSLVRLEKKLTIFRSSSAVEPDDDDKNADSRNLNVPLRDSLNLFCLPLRPQTSSRTLSSYGFNQSMALPKVIFGDLCGVRP